MNYANYMRAEQAFLSCCEENAKKAKEKQKQKEVKKTINFDMDGTLVDLYGVDDWLEMLTNFDSTPYIIAKPLLRLNHFARIINQLQKQGYNIAIISWLSKGADADYKEKVTAAKLYWLEKHLPSVHWDSIIIMEYGQSKEKYCNTPYDILFDDEEQNRKKWGGMAFDENDIIEYLKLFKEFL